MTKCLALCDVLVVDGIHRCGADLAFLNATQAEVTGGWWRSPQSAASYTFELKKVDGVWVVTGERLNAES
ncbi:MAG: hypothetical protein J0L73_14345 [Verrucomicrobia bacterium]|nr:hypothetical protein [Verrucomicrobiota bacterium]